MCQIVTLFLLISLCNMYKTACGVGGGKYYKIKYIG